MKVIILTILFLILSLIVTTAGALQCFAPRKRRELEKRLRLNTDWSASAGGKFLEELAERNASNPPLSYRLMGLMFMAVGMYMFVIAMMRLIRAFTS
jgi:hypothetical protein